MVDDINLVNEEALRKAKELNEMLYIYRQQKEAKEEYERQRNLEEEIDSIAPFKEGQIVSEIKIVPKIMINKWWGAIPSVTEAGAGLSLGASIAAITCAPVIAGLGMMGALAYAGFLIGDKIPLNQDNWYAQETFGTRFFGQKDPWKGKQYKTLSLVANVFKKDYLSKEWYERDLDGERVKFDKKTGELITRADRNYEKKEKNDEIERIRMWTQPEFYTIGKIGTRLPDPVNLAAIERETEKYKGELVKKGIKGEALENELGKIRSIATERERLKANYANIPQFEQLHHDEEENNFNIEIVCVPNFKDIAEGIEARKKDYHYEVLKNGEEWLKVGESHKPRRELYGKIFTKIPKQFLQEFFGLYKKPKMPNPMKAIGHALANTVNLAFNIPKYFQSLGARRYQITTRYRDIEEKQWYLDKNPIKSMFWGNYYELRKSSEGKPIAIIQRERINSFLYKSASLGGRRPCYDIKISDPQIANNKYFVRFLVDMAYQLDRENEEHKLRFKEYVGRDIKGKLIPNMNNPMWLKEAGILGEFTPDRLVARSENA